MKRTPLVAVIVFAALAISAQSENHVKNVRQLTFGGDNAEAYWSFDSKKLVFQSNFKKWNVLCDQIFVMDVKKAAKDSLYKPKMVSTGKGRTTCSYFMPGDKKVLYASTHASADSCPPPPAHIPGKYLWPVYSEYDIYVADVNGKVVSRLTDSPGYDAEATVSPQGDKIVFTSDRSGDLELWVMDIDGKNQKQITSGLGYDGGAFFSPDGKKIVFRASRPQSEEEVKEYKELLAKGLVSPMKMEIYTCNADGTGLKQITNLGKANWAPFFTPKGDKIIFSSNHHSKKGFDFQLWLINADGTGLEQVTTESVFNSFPMFSPDGKKISFSSNRNNKGSRDTNVFVADWTE